MENSTDNALSVTALFASKADAENVYESLLKLGVSKENISVVISEGAHYKNISGEEEKTEAADSAGLGALLGGATGGITTAIAAVATNLALPGLGLLFVGPLLAGLAGATGGALAGGAIGAMIGYGFPKEQASNYDAGVRQGSVLVSVVAGNLVNRNVIVNTFRNNNGSDIYVHNADGMDQPA